MAQFFDSPTRYAGSVSAQFDAQLHGQKLYRRFWHENTPHQDLEKQAFPLQRGRGPAALGNNAKSQASDQNQGLTSADFTVFSRDGYEVQLLDDQTGEIRKGKIRPDGGVTFGDQADNNRAGRYRLQAQAGKLLPKHRVSLCNRRIADNASPVRIIRHEETGSTSFQNLQTCGSVWSCPVCAAKISERRRVEVKTALDVHLAAGGSAIFVTYTIPHRGSDDLKDMLNRISSAMSGMKSDRRYKANRLIVGQIGTIRALEVTHGGNGWHPHIHEIWLTETASDLDRLRFELFELWRLYAVKNQFLEPSESHGVTVQNGDFVAAYVTKFGHEPTRNVWGPDQELTKSHIKNGGRGGRTPFQILADSVHDSDSSRLFVEYSKAFKGARQLVWSRGLKDKFGIANATDEELAALQESGECVIKIPKSNWDQVIKQGDRFTLLALAQFGGAPAVEIYFESLGFPIPRATIHRPVVERGLWQAPPPS